MFKYRYPWSPSPGLDFLELEFQTESYKLPYGCGTKLAVILIYKIYNFSIDFLKNDMHSFKSHASNDQIQDFQRDLL